MITPYPVLYQESKLSLSEKIVKVKDPNQSPFAIDYREYCNFMTLHDGQGICRLHVRFDADGVDGHQSTHPNIR